MANPKSETAHKVDVGDVLGIVIEGVLGKPGEALPYGIPSEPGEPLAIGYPILVQANGKIVLPHIEGIKVKGMTLLQVQKSLRDAYMNVKPAVLTTGNERILVTLYPAREQHVLAALKEAEAALELKQKKLLLLKPLFEKGYVTAVELSEAAAEVKKAQADLKNAKANFEQFQKQAREEHKSDKEPPLAIAPVGNAARKDIDAKIEAMAYYEQNAKIEVAAAESKLGISELKVDRFKRLVAHGSLPKGALDEAIAETKVASTELKVTQAVLELENAKTSLFQVRKQASTDPAANRKEPAPVKAPLNNNGRETLPASRTGERVAEGCTFEGQADSPSNSPMHRWDEVFRWFTKESGLPFVSADQAADRHVQFHAAQRPGWQS